MTDKITESAVPNNLGLSPKVRLFLGGSAIVIVLLLLGALLLPPFSLGHRLWPGTAAAAPPSVAPTLPDGFRLLLPQAAVTSMPQVTAVSMLGPLAAALPSHLLPVGPVYRLAYEGVAPPGQVGITRPVQADDSRNLDLYAWDGTQWHFLPAQWDGEAGEFVSLPGPLPQAVALMRAERTAVPVLAAEWISATDLPAVWHPYLTEASTAVLHLSPAGAFTGQPPLVTKTPYAQYVRATNRAPVIDEGALQALLTDMAVQANQLDGLANRAQTGGYAGVNLDLQGVNAAQLPALSRFVVALAERLQQHDKQLVVTISQPATMAVWQAAGEQWAAIGAAADLIYLEMPLNPAAYGAGMEAEQWLRQAIQLLPRHKVNLLLTAASIDNIGLAYQPLPPTGVAALFGGVQLKTGSSALRPGEAVTVALPGPAQSLSWDDTTHTYRIGYEKLPGQPHQVWLGNMAGLSRRLSLVSSYRLRGATILGLDQVLAPEAYTAVFAHLINRAPAPEPTGVAIAWVVRAADESIVASETAEDLSFTWQGIDEPGTYLIQADLAQGDAILPLGMVTVTVATAGVATAVPPTAAPNATGDATVNADANVRQGPGLNYAILTGATRGTAVTLLGRNTAATWFQVRLPGQEEGWILGTLLDLDPAVNALALPAIPVPPPAGGSSAAPLPPAAPVTNTAFELGGQTHSLGNPALMSYAGMTWVKFQHKWRRGDAPEAVARLIQQGHANGFKVLLSIPGADHGTIDYAAYATFLGGVAALGPDAIEVWNEQNIDREWPSGQISAATYVNEMLAPAYRAIKAANPGVMVISGAPAPTGFYGGCSGGGCDDGLFIAGMAAAGAANYMDCLGVHYNEGIMPPGQTSGDPRTEHYTRYFWGMVNTYSRAFGGARPLCFTELGYLSGQDYGGLPVGFAWASQTTIAQHAQWLAEAVSLAAGQGSIRLVIIFNVDFTTFGADPQAGYAMVRKDGSCPACESLHQVMR